MQQKHIEKKTLCAILCDCMFSRYQALLNADNCCDEEGNVQKDLLNLTHQSLLHQPYMLIRAD